MTEGWRGRGFARFGADVYFAASTPLQGFELWASDGTAAGTAGAPQLAARLAVGGGEEGPPRRARESRQLGRVRAAEARAEVGEVEHPATGAELWASDGTAAGTGLVRDLDPGPSSASPSALTEVDGRLVFAAAESVHGRELWASDGTEAGTRLLADVAAGAASSSPSDLGVSSELVGFRADDGTTGGGGLTDVGHTIEVRDRVTGEVRTYRHEPGALGGEADVAAF